MKAVCLLMPALLAGLGHPPAQEAGQSADGLFAQAEQLLASGQLEQAAARLEEALALDPRHWRSLCRLGEIHAAARRFPEAEKALRAAVEISPDSGPCLSRLAQVLLVNERVEEAERFLVRAAGLMPQDEAVLFNLGRLYETTGRPDQAVEIYRRHLAAAPDGRRAAATFLKVARLLGAARKPAEAVAYYQGYLKGQPDRHEVRAEMAAALFGASRYDEAMAEYEKVLAAGVADPATLSNAGSICLLRMDLPRAVDLLGRAVAASPREIPPRIGLATALAQSGDQARAVEVLRGVAADDPENPRVWFLLGQSLIKLGKAEEGREALRRHQSIHERIMRERMSGKPEGHP